jgi:hypothetical protein
MSTSAAVIACEVCPNFLCDIVESEQSRLQRFAVLRMCARNASIAKFSELPPSLREIPRPHRDSALATRHSHNHQMSKQHAAYNDLENVPKALCDTQMINLKVVWFNVQVVLHLRKIPTSYGMPIMITMPFFDRFAFGRKGRYAGKPSSIKDHMMSSLSPH